MDRSFLKSAMEAIDTIKSQKGFGNELWQGVIECPKCKGRLHWRAAGRKMHVHAQCETVNCITFME